MSRYEARAAIHTRKAAAKDAISSNDNALRARNAVDCKSLREATLAAIKRQAAAWGIAPEQAQTLLLDRRMPA